jgi:metallo-beta-lactamase class B
MFKNTFQYTVLAIILSFTSIFSSAQTVQEPKPWTEDWAKPYEPFRIAGNLYYVGTYDLACYLITTSQGNILINTGLASSAAQIEKNIQSLGLKFSDIKILLTTQAHYDHVGAMSAIKKKTGAQFFANKNEVPVLEDGGRTDYALGGEVSSFEPVVPDRLLKDGDTIQLGDMKLVMLHHPGHTKGSGSFLFTVKDDKQSWKVLVANMPSIVTGKRFSEITSYPEIAKDYAYTLKVMKGITFDLWLASHASQFNMHYKRKPGDGYNPAAFMDKAGYEKAVSSLQKQYDEKMKQ